MPHHLRCHGAAFIAVAHAKIRPMFLTIPTIMTWTRIVAIPLIVGVFYLDIA